jgi:hypothetical protein
VRVDAGVEAPVVRASASTRGLRRRSSVRARVDEAVEAAG